MDYPNIPLEYLKKQALQDAISRIYKSFYQEEIEENPIDYLRIDEDDDVIEWLKNRPTGLDYTHTFVTVTPKSTVTFEEFKKKVEKSLTKKWIDEAWYVYEWRQFDRGLHLHMLIKFNKNKKPSEVHREFWSTFKKLLGLSKKNVNVKNSNRPKNLMQYLKGWKHGARKKNYAQDIINRIQLDILDPKKPIYHHLERSAKLPGQES